MNFCVSLFLQFVLQGPGLVTDFSAMRLLKLREDGEFILVERAGRNIPPYAILSHTWGADEEEVSFKDLIEGRGKNKAGYRKLRFCGEQAAKDALHFFWVDTCCIDKSSSSELSEAINSMFRWYLYPRELSFFDGTLIPA